MLNLNISSAVKTAKNVITANSPVLLVGTAIAGVVTTGVLAAKGGYKARGMVDEAEKERGSDLTYQEKAQLTWLCYVSPAVAGATSIASTVGVHTIHTKRHAALAGLYAIGMSKMDAYSDEAEKLLGAKKTQDLNNAYAAKRIGDGPTDTTEITLVDGGNELFLDDYTGRWLRTSMAKIEEAANDISRMLLTEEFVSLNKFYDILKLDETQLGDMIGWNGPDPVRVSFGTTRVDSDGGNRAVSSFWFQNNPRLGGAR